MNFLLTSGIFYPDIGGPSSYLRELIKYIINIKKKKVIIITLGNIDKRIKIYSTKNIEIIKINRNINKFERFIITTFIIFKKLKKNTKLYANGLFFEVGLICILKNKKFISKIVGDYHWERFVRLGLYKLSIEKFNKKKYIFLINYVRKITFFKCKKIIVPSKYLKSVVQSWGIKREFQVINNFLGPKKNRLLLKNEKFTEILKNNSDKKIIITVSRLIKHKNIDFLIKNLKFENYIFFIIGSGPEYSEIERLIKIQKLEDKIFLLGNLENSKIYSLMKQSNIFLLHSSYEGFPHVVLEAITNNLLCILSDVGGNSEIIKNNHNGFLIKLFNVKELNEKIKLVLTDNNMGYIRNNAKITLKKFNKNKLLAQTFNVISK